MTTRFLSPTPQQNGANIAMDFRFSLALYIVQLFDSHCSLGLFNFCSQPQNALQYSDNNISSSKEFYLTTMQ